MKEWRIEFSEEAEKDLEKLDKSQQLLVLKAIKKVAVNPLPKTEGGYGKPLGNHLTTKMAGFLKIKLVKMGIRVVYKLVHKEHSMLILVISVRDDKTAYRLAMSRLKT